MDIQRNTPSKEMIRKTEQMIKANDKRFDDSLPRELRRGDILTARGIEYKCIKARGGKFVLKLLNKLDPVPFTIPREDYQHGA